VSGADRGARNADLAALLAPLVLVAWFLWPLRPFDSTLTDIALAFPAAYAFFFLARFLRRRAISFIGRSSPQLLLAMSFLAADAISLLVRFCLAGMTSGVDVDRELRGAALDSLWCTVAAAIAEWRYLRRREEDDNSHSNG
jgi:hypothetical protein